MVYDLVFLFFFRKSIYFLYVIFFRVTPKTCAACTFLPWLVDSVDHLSFSGSTQRSVWARIPTVGAPQVAVERQHGQTRRNIIFRRWLAAVTVGAHQAPRWVPIGQVRIRRSTTSNNVQLLSVGVEAGAFVQQPARGAPVGPRLQGGLKTSSGGQDPTRLTAGLRGGFFCELIRSNVVDFRYKE